MSVTTICSVCHKKMNLAGWVDQFLDQYENLSQAYCPECYRQAVANLQAAPKKSQPRLMRFFNRRSLTKDAESRI